MRHDRREDIDSWIRDNLDIDFVRSGGPGGQNVNKLNTKAVARLELDAMELLSEEEKGRVRGRLRNRINREGRIVLSSQEHRTQLDNRRAVSDRMVHLVLSALERRRRRVPTRPTRAAVERRIQEKKRRAERKRRRKAPPSEDV